MNYRLVFKELTYVEYKVLTYCLLHKRDKWSHMDYGRWLGLEYGTALANWNKGIDALIREGYMVKEGFELKWNREKIKEVLKEEKFD